MAALANIPRQASKGIGGLKYVLLANYADITTTTDSSSGYVTFQLADASTTITPTNSPFKKFTMTKESSDFTVTGTGNIPAGTTAYAHVLKMVFAKNEAAKRNAVQIMGNSELVAVAVTRAQDASGNYVGWVLGAENGLDMTSSVTGSGTAVGDLNGPTITLSGNQINNEGNITQAVLASITPTGS
jgi:hypothetical protein